MTATAKAPAKRAPKKASLQDKVRGMIEDLGHEVVGNENVINTVVLSALAGVPCMLLGPPGIGKSLVVDRFLDRIIGIKDFRITLNEFMSTDEVLGPITIPNLKAGKNERSSDGYLPWAEGAFIDEWTRSTGPVAGAFLNILNEGFYFDGARRRKVALRLSFFACNYLPDEEEAYGAVCDRMITRLDITRTPATDTQTRLRIMLSEMVADKDIKTIEAAEFAECQRQVSQMPVSMEFLQTFLCEELVPALDRQSSQLIEQCSDRRLHRGVRVAKALAWLTGAKEVQREHGIVYKDIVWSDPSDAKVVADIVAEKAGATSITIEGNEMISEVEALLEAHQKALDEALTKGDDAPMIIAQETNDSRSKLDDITKDWQDKLRNLPQKEAKLVQLQKAMSTINAQMQKAMTEYTKGL